MHLNMNFLAACLAVFLSAGCVSTSVVHEEPIPARVARLDAACATLPASSSDYDVALRNLASGLISEHPQEAVSRLQSDGISVRLPKIDLPLKSIHPSTKEPVPGEIGIPVVLEYETRDAPLYPPEGLFVDGSVVYEPGRRQGFLDVRTAPGSVAIGNRKYPLAFDPTGAGDQLRQRAQRLAKSGFASMIRPSSIARKPQIYLLDPYDPKKIPLLMVHGLQSTPVAFATLVNALRSDPEIRSRYQIWQFYYASGTPVLANAAALRDSLDATRLALDPKGGGKAVRDVVVLGHSMGGVISHTLVSSSGNAVWSSVFRKAPQNLRGDPAAIRTLEHILFFRRDPRVARVVFMAAPHRGSPMAESWIGIVGNGLSKLPAMEEKGFSQLARDNADAMMPGATQFYAGGRFSAVRTLSPRSTALVALSRLPIEVPYHSIIGQKKPGPKEKGSDGVVPYWSSHLDGAQSEVIVRGDHGVINLPDAIAETIRILHLPDAGSR